MLTDCPDPKEVADFHFLQLRTICMIKENENIPAKSINFLASASKYGLLFIGMEEGFKVLKLDDVLSLDENKEIRSIERNFSCLFVPSGTPVILAVNSSQTTLAVCVRHVSGILINLYSLPAFPDSGAAWQPFCSNTVSTAFEMQDFAWNPTLEGLYTFCLGDGSLHIHEVTGTSFKSIASLQDAKAMSVCWSPKGKQLVVGKQNGSFSQYKPTLQEVKTVVPPPFEESPVAVTSICWISNTVFAVVYVAGDTPNLFIVSTPKDSAVVYTNFNDVCLGNNSPSYQKYFLHLESLWGLLICASLDSIEIAVLGDMPNWVQWDLKEDGKALLPGKDGATHAVGMAVMYSAQRQIIISESESYPPMPVMFFLTNNGLLVSFHMINTRSEAASLVSPPLSLELKMGTENGFFTDVTQVIQKEVSQSPCQLDMSSTFVADSVSVPSQMPVLHISEPQNNITAPYGAIKNATFSLADQCKEPLKSFGSEMHVHSLNKPEAVAFTQVQKTQEKSCMKIGPMFAGAEKQNEAHSSTDNSYMMAIISEIQSFTKELHDLKQLQNSAPTIDGEEDMISLKIFALNLHNFQNDIFETMQSLSSDIYSLKNLLLECFVMVEEACSRERRRNDHSYITLLKERALDPITAKRMQKMNQHYQYLRTQLQEVSDRLDQDWIHLISNKKKSVRSNPCISSTEAIYKTIVNNQKIIHNLKRKIDLLVKKNEEKKLRNTTKSGTWGKYHRRIMQEDLSELADEFLQVKIALQEEGESTGTKKMSTESQNFLKSFLKESSVITVRPTAVYSPSQSRLLSNAVPSENFSECDQEKDISSKQVSTLTSPESEASIMISSASESPAPAICSMTSVKPTSANESIPEPCAPVYEPVTPPDTVNVLQPINKTFTASSILVSPLSKDKYPKVHDVHQSFSTVTTPVIMQKDSTHLDYGLNVSSSVASNIVHHTSSSFTGAKLPTLNQASESTCTASTLPIFSKTPLSTACMQSVGNSSVSNYERKDTLWSIETMTSSSISESKKSVAPESLQIIPQKMMPSCAAVSCTPLGQNTHLVAVTAQAPSTSLLLTPVSKNSLHFDPSQTATLFQRSHDDVDPSILSEKDESETIVIVSSNVSPDENVSFPLDLVNKSSLNSKSTDRLDCSIDVQKSISSMLPDNFASSNETSDLTKTDALTITNSESPNTNSISDLKQVEPSVSMVSKPSISFSSMPLVSMTPHSTSTASVVTVNPVPSVTTTKLIPHSDPTVSKSSTPSEATSVPVPLFGQNVTICSPISSENNSDSVKKAESSATLAFESKSTFFGKPSSETSFFHTTTTTTADAATFSQPSVTQTASSFGQPSNFPPASDGFFSQAPSFGAATTAATAPVTNSETSTFSFGKPAFGQTMGSFGLAKSFFPQNTTPVTQSAASPSFSFGQNSNLTFGQGSFFSGLGGKPSEENASKNVFGISSGVKSPETSNLFRNSGVTSFGAVNSSSSFTETGNFGSGSGSVAQSGFGSFQQSPIQQPGGFGASPAFGTAPAFGSAPAFGASPTFGSGNALSSIFGQQQQVSSNFSNFANASSPTFGSLASQSPGGFSSPPVVGGGFGSPASPAFGPSTFGAVGFGNQTPSFGSPSSPPSNSSAFTQWRN